MGIENIFAGKLENMKPILGMIWIQLTYAGVGLFTRAAILQGMSPRVFVVYRQAIATVFIVPIAFLSRRQGNNNRASMGLKSFSLIFLASLIGVAINMNIFAEGLYLASASIAGATNNLVPAITFVIATALGLEHVDIRNLRSIAKIAGTALCVGGAIVMALLRGPKLLNNSKEDPILLGSIFGYGIKGCSDDSTNWILGCLYLFGSCCCWSIWLILQVPMAAGYPDYVSLSAWMCFLSTLQAAALTVVFERNVNIWIPNSKFQIGSAIYCGVVGSGIAYFVQAWCIARRGPLFSAMFTPLCTVIITILGAIFLQEEVYIGSVAGAIGVIIGLYIVLWGKGEDVAVAVVDRNYLDKSKCKINLQKPLLSTNSTSGMNSV